MATESDGGCSEAAATPPLLALAAPGAIPVVVAHSDQARSKVSTTAMGVATLRAFESEKPPEERLFYDPLAAVLADPAKQPQWWTKTNQPKCFWVDFIATRTRHIDDRISALAKAEPDMQIVVVGSGLDTRAFRLEGLQGKLFFELDFGELLEAKDVILSAEGDNVPLAQRVSVACDLTGVDDWTKALVSSGYNPSQSSLWLLEGLTGYLHEEELHSLFRGISSIIAGPSSMLVTFLGTAMQKANEATDMHRFYVRDKAHIAELLDSHGWSASEVLSIPEIAARYGRQQNIPPTYEYFVAETARPGISAA